MNPIKAAEIVTTQLVKEGAKLVILSGSAARGKKDPNDLDITGVFENENNLKDHNYKNTLVKKLGLMAKYKIHLFDYSELFVSSLIEEYNKDPGWVCRELNYICQDDVTAQGQGWPLVWIFGEKARETLKPYGCFQEKFNVLYGEEYLTELRNKTITYNKED